MLQTVLLMAIVGLAVLHLLRPPREGGQRSPAELGWPPVEEGFDDAEPPGYPTTPVDPTYRTASPAADHPAADADPPEDDPRDLPWIASWSPADRAARRGQNCAVHFQQLGPHNTIIQTVSKSCEAGMAHTRPGNRIIMPDSIPEAMRAETLKHEMYHIYQRRHPSSWREFYHRSWGFEFHEAPPASMPASVRDARRSNPDTWDPATGGPWPCWKGRYWPVPVYRDPQRPRLRDARTVWWDATLQQLLMEPPHDWTVFFGNQPQEEHPHELAAVLLTAEDTASEAGRRINIWWQLHGPFLSS